MITGTVADLSTNVPGKRAECRACGNRTFDVVLDLGPQPLAGGFLQPDADLQAERKFDLAVYVCGTCALVQILDPVDPEVLFQDYSFSSSTVKPLVNHFAAYAQTLRDRFGPKTVVEFGCNDGVLLRPLEGLGIRAIGVDVSKNITDIARESGLDARTGYFDLAMAQDIKEEIGCCDIVTGSNAFAHNDHPERILEAASTLLAEDGVLAIEFMYAGDLNEQLQWDTLYHEHLTFYSLGTVSCLLERYGFFVFDAEHLPMHGGCLRIFASKTRRPMSGAGQAIAIKEAETHLNEIDTWRRFAAESRRRISIVDSVVGALARSGARISAYGAAGKATMWVNAANMTYLNAVVDESPLRAGKLMPGTHTPIVFPDELRKIAPDYIFVSAWNYADLIRSKETWFQGTWITPLPDLRFF